MTLLSTPQSRDYKGVPADGFNTANLCRDVSLLPTPAVNDMGDNKTVAWWDEWTAKTAAKHNNGNGHGNSLAIEMKRLADAGRWAKYADAIERWEQILGRPAPDPTTPGKSSPQLSPRFVEWMMGLPEGWVDDVPNLTRIEKIKALGNCVVSQQAVEATHRLVGLAVAA
jgi:DNA (cytosine-5)-methyltransferase 1